MFLQILIRVVGKFTKPTTYGVLALLLASCAAPAPKQASEQMAGTHGYLFATLPIGTASSVLVLKSQQDGTEVRLDPRQDANGRSAGRWLPPGEYSIASWEGIACKDYPLIKVEAGRITDMGSLLKVPVGGYDFVLLPVSNAETHAYRTPVTTEFKRLLKSTIPIEWRVETPPKPLTTQSGPTGLGLIADLLMQYERHVNKPSNNKLLRAAKTTDEFLRLAKEGSPPITEQPAVTPAKDLLYGSSLGSVRVTRGDGTWRYLDTGTLAGVRAVETNGDSIYAGTDAGTIRQSLDGGSTWTEIVSLGSGATIVDIDHVNNSWYVVAIYLSKSSVVPTVDRITIYRGNGTQPAELLPIKEIASGAASFYWYRVRGQVNNHSYFLSTNSGVLKLDLNTDKWVELNTPSSITGFFTAPASSVLTAFKAQGIFSKLFVSSDGGNTWQARETPPYNIDDVYFSSSDSGVATRWHAHVFSATLEWLHYEPGKAWVSDAEAPVGCIRILRNEQLIPTYCVTTGGSILKESGGKWNVEFASD